MQFNVFNCLRFLDFDEIFQIVECKCFPFSSYRDQPGNAIKSTFEGHLKDMLNTARRGPKRLFYEIVSFLVL